MKKFLLISASSRKNLENKINEYAEKGYTVIGVAEWHEAIILEHEGLPKIESQEQEEQTDGVVVRLCNFDQYCAYQGEQTLDDKDVLECTKTYAPNESPCSRLLQEITQRGFDNVG